MAVFCDPECVCRPLFGFPAEHQLKTIVEERLETLPEQLIIVFSPLISRQMIELRLGLRRTSLDVVSGRVYPLRTNRDEIAALTFAKEIGKGDQFRQGLVRDPSIRRQAWIECRSRDWTEEPLP